MEKTLLPALGIALLAASATAATPAQPQLPENFDAWNLNFRPPEASKSTAETPVRVAKKSRLANREASEGDPTSLTVAAQTYHKDYRFNYNGGTVTTYSITVSRNGDKVTIGNLFNLEAQSTDWSKGVDYDITGTYDETAGTITIPTLQDFENATLAGTIGTYYTCVLVSGTVTTDGKMTPADELVLNVTGDFEEITATQDFGIMNYTPEGVAMGTQTLYRRFNAVLPTTEPRLIAFNNVFDLGETFPGQEASTGMSVVNVSSSDADFAISMESDDNAFSVTPEAGTIAGGSIQELTFRFLPPSTGDFEGLATIAYEGANTTPSPLEALLTGKAIALPDFSAIIDKGDFSFATNIEFPFFPTILSDGSAAAQSGTQGQYGTSKLTASFTVPEGNIGVLKWKSDFTNEGQWNANAGGLFSDDAPAAWLSTNQTGDLSGSYEYGPGEHSMRWQYESLQYTGNENNMMTVSHLELTCTAAKADDVKLITETVNLGNHLLKGNDPVEANGSITIRNYGTNPLKVNSVASDNPAFSATRPTSEAALLEELAIPVILNATAAGKYEGNITLSTSAGDVTTHVTALVRQMADFSPLVKEGADLVTNYSTDTSYPFEMADGVAYNTTSGEADDQATTSWFQIDFTVPEGKAVYMGWDGHLYGSQPDPDMYWVGDYGGVDFRHPMSSGMYPLYGTDLVADSDVTINADESWKNYMVCIPGEHSLKFIYMKNGDGIISEKDRLEISAIRLHLVDFEEHAVEASVSEINFDKTYVGEDRYLTAVVTLKNTGSSPLEIYDEIESQAPFYGVVPENRYPVQFPQTIDVGIWFYPSEEGTFEGKVTFKTSAGDVVINCTGSTESSEGILLIGDIEDSANGWSFYDADKDGDCWNLGYNLWGNNPEWCHSGSDCFGSPSWSPYYGAIEPDNWLFSPTVSIPEEGAVLRWYAAAHHHERFAENYSVYVCTPEEIQDVENLRLLEPCLTETLPADACDSWIEHVVDLADYAGKDVNIAFRHYDCNGQYVLKIDDIFVYTHEKYNELSGVESIGTSPAPVSTEIYNTAGMRLRQLSPGINIVRTTGADGKIETRKIIVK